MKTLFVNRHAKSSWGNPNQSDFERPLNERGLRDAPTMAERLKTRGELIDFILSSTANRALTTARTFAHILNLEENAIVENETMYGASTQTILQIVNGLDNGLNSVIIFGHNPTFTAFANYLTGSLISNIPTCGIVKIEFDIDSWAEVSAGMGRQVYFDYPKNEA